MTRVVKTKNYKGVEEAVKACPVQAFRRGPKDELVIDPSICIDCGVCQTIAEEGSIVEDSEATDTEIKFNEDNASKWPEA